MEVSVGSVDRIIRQIGVSLGPLEGFVVEELDAEAEARVMEALDQTGTGVVLSADHQTVTVVAG